MASLVVLPHFSASRKCLLQICRGTASISLRHQSTLSTAKPSSIRAIEHGPLRGTNDEGRQSPSLARVPTRNILRSLFMSTVFTSPLLFRPGLAIMKTICHSRSPLLNPDLNPLLRLLVKPLVYDHFCAGRDRSEIQRTRDSIRSMGFAGIILCYGREIVLPASHREDPSNQSMRVNEERDIEAWKKGNLETLDMIDKGDWLGLKFTGAGSGVTDALSHSKDPSQRLVDAMNSICEKAKRQGCRVWIDAEQHALQPAIDRWAVDFMRKHNTGERAVVYNTVQAYLKYSRNTLREHMDVARRESWTLGIKLVRGAYIGSDPRHIIHDTKSETDACYDGIVGELLSGGSFGLPGDLRARTDLFIAGHNPRSVSAALDLIESLKSRGELHVLPDFGQLQGMADELGCEIIQCGERLGKETAGAVQPRVFKCLTWGSVQECMQFLLRRMVENRGGAERVRDGRAALLVELKRRLWTW